MVGSCLFASVSAESASEPLAGAGPGVLGPSPACLRLLRSHPGAMLTSHVAFSSDVALVDLRRHAPEELVARPAASRRSGRGKLAESLMSDLTASEPKLEDFLLTY